MWLIVKLWEQPVPDRVLGVFIHRDSYNVLKELIKTKRRGNIYISMKKKIGSRC